MTNKDSISYRIFHSTFILGSAHLFVIFFNLLKNKTAAFLLGSEGIGMIALLSSVIDLVKSFSSLGIDQSGIREMGCSQKNKLSTIAIIKKWTLLSSVFGAFICIFFSKTLSRFAFGNDENYLYIMLLSIPIFISILTSARLTIIKGLGFYKKVALYNSISALASLILSSSLYFLLGFKGIVLSLILSSAASYIISAISYQQCVDNSSKPSSSPSLKDGWQMIKLGLFTVFSSISYSAALFIARSFINSKDSLSAIGVFQASFTITIMYSALILQSLSTEYFPRLSSVSYSNRKMSYYVNKQLSSLAVMALPLLSIMMLLSPFVIRILYSIEFSDSVQLLQMHLFGALLRIFSIPMAYILLVEKRGATYMFTEISWGVVYFISMYLLWPHFGLSSTAIAYILSYIYYFIVVAVSTRITSQFRISLKALKRIIFSLLFLLSSMLAMMFFNKEIISIIF
ncbi:MAG: oligosaccharide flippase family protein [Bacteroidales bacterium]|nr:oligosaccharide flippase family protein [Bacteroidales bacterium]